MSAVETRALETEITRVLVTVGDSPMYPSQAIATARELEVIVRTYLLEHFDYAAANVLSVSELWDRIFPEHPRR